MRRCATAHWCLAASLRQERDGSGTVVEQDEQDSAMTGRSNSPAGAPVPLHGGGGSCQFMLRAQLLIESSVSRLSRSNRSKMLSTIGLRAPPVAILAK